MKSIFKQIGYFIFCDICFAAIYFFTKDIFISLLVALFGVLVASKVIVPNYIKAANYMSTVEQTNKFINGMIVQLSVTPSLDEALDKIKPYCSILLQRIIENSNYENIVERIEQISYQLNHPLMYVFIQQLKVYNEQGGDILRMSKQVIEQTNHLKSSVHLFASIKRRKLREFTIIWGFSMFSLLYLRLGLEDYYSLVLEESAIFKYAVALSFAILFISYGMYYLKYGDYYMEKGWDI